MTTPAKRLSPNPNGRPRKLPLERLVEQAVAAGRTVLIINPPDGYRLPAAEHGRMVVETQLPEGVL